MANRIETLTESTAPEATKPVFAQLKMALGMVPNLYAQIGHSAGTLKSVLGWDAAVQAGPLSGREIEQINLHVSELNGCAYCVSAHNALGKRAGLSDAEIDAARAGRGSSEREDALLALARRVVRTGGVGAGSELARVREAGVSDAEIIDVLAAVALKVFTNAVGVVSQTEIDFPKPAHLPSV